MAFAVDVLDLPQILVVVSFYNHLRWFPFALLL